MSEDLETSTSKLYNVAVEKNVCPQREQDLLLVRLGCDQSCRHFHELVSPNTIFTGVSITKNQIQQGFQLSIISEALRTDHYIDPNSCN